MTTAPTSTPEPTPSSLEVAPVLGRRSKMFGVFAVLGALLGGAAGVRLADRASHPSAKASAELSAEVLAVKRASADKSSGLTVVEPGQSARTVDASGPLAKGSVVRTDARTRARLRLSDGSELVLDRSSELAIEGGPRSVRLTEGSVLVEAAHVEGAPPLRLLGPHGTVSVIGTRLVLTSTAERANVEVLRGEVDVDAPMGRSKVLAGQEAVLAKGQRPEVVPATDMARRSAFGEAFLTHNEDTEGDVAGLGELRAKKPGKTEEKDRAVRLARHDVKVRVAGAVARTEIEEVFTNDTDDELEGLYRFPLPPSAQIEKLALDVDGKLVDGEFVDASRAQAIWRGVIHNAAPTAPKPREEWVWVPGPWRDPALLEWKRGGRFELKIFPIPKRGSRRVVIAYTEAVAPSSGVRRYTYPLPHGTASDMPPFAMHVDAKVVGFEGADGVRARGYELTRGGGATEVTLTMDDAAFRPSGDLVLEYTTADKASPMSSYAFRSPAHDGKPGDTYAAFALRPNLPKWSDVRPRDQVVVIDSGRAMFGERFLRARRLAVQMIQEMDRRDRVTVLACDLRCKPLASGFVGPGAAAAHDVDAFLSAITPDGASDLVGAVGAAARVDGHDGARDLRVTVLSTGNATAGHKALSRVAAEVRDRIGAGAHTQVSAVPIGGDSDTAFLSELTKGGGGVVVPYQPGETLASAALAVLNASYGTVLRDPVLVLPEGLVEAAPAVLPPLRAGGEALLAAKMLRERVEGDVILRGTVGGEPFEQKIPVSLVATDAPGNAFVPRVYAQYRIADRELQPGDAARAEAVDLSKRFAVPSRFTSLLVLESEAMFQAFGVGRTKRTEASFTGDDVARGDVAQPLAHESDKDESGLGGALALADSEPSSKSKESRAAAPAARPAPTMAPQEVAPQGGAGGGLANGPFDVSPAKKAAAPRDDWGGGFGRRGGGEWMRRVWRRVAVVHEGAGSPVPAEKVSAARAALAAAPDERNRHRELAKLLAQTNDLDELDAVLTKWNERDPLDADAIAWRADLVARRGDRAGAMRILTGALSSPTLSPKDAAKLARASAEAYERTGDLASACALRVTVSDLLPEDVDAAGRAMRCEEANGRPKSSERIRIPFAVKPREGALASVLTRLAQEKNEPPHGDVVVSATWEGGEDLDLAIVDPSGGRASVVSRTPGLRVADATSRGHEELGLANPKAGAFVVEVTRSVRGTTRPASGTVKITSSGVTKTVPFTLTGDRVVVGRVEAHYEETLVSESGDRSVPPPGLRPFDAQAARTALAAVSVESCGRPGGPTGAGHVSVTFGPTGFVTSAVVDGGPFNATPTGACIAARFRAVRIPPYAGSVVSVGRTFVLRSHEPIVPF